MGDEEFGHIEVDRQTSAPKWDGQVPYLDYWKVRLDKSVLTREQSEYYAYIKQCVNRGVAIKNYAINSYLLMLRDEIIRSATRAKDRQAIIDTIKKLGELYGFNDFSLNDILKKEAENMRKNRIFRYRREPKARWISPGQHVQADGVELSRGGFYLGSHLKFSRFNLQSGDFFKSGWDIEGPIVNVADKAPNVDPGLIPYFHTYVEMTAEQQSKLITWLKGGAIDDLNIFRYYLAGIQVRLLADADTTNDERRQVIDFLIDLATSDELKRFYYQHDARELIYKLVDFTLARYFADSQEPEKLESISMPWPQLSRARLAMLLSGLDTDNFTDQAIADAVVDGYKVPNSVPEVYHNAYLSVAKRKIYDSLSRHTSIYNDIASFSTRDTQKGYMPDEAVAEILKREPINIDNKLARRLDRISTVLNELDGEFFEFNKFKAAGASVVSQARRLPRWCDPKLLPGFVESMKQILPQKGESFRTIKLGDLLDEVGIRYMFEDTLGSKDIEQVNMQLYRLGLRISTTLIRGTKLKLDETVAVYDLALGDVSTRGSMAIGLFLTAWMVSADKVTERDFAVTDQWIENGTDKGTVPAKAALRWLANRKLTLSAKRKAKAMQLMKFPKKRDELVHMLLSIIADAETVSAKRMERLQTIYTLVGLDPATIHSDLHRMATTPNVAAKKMSSSATLDKARLREMTASTAEAQKILASVFTDSDEQQVASVEPETTSADDPTLAILRLLHNKREWSRSEFDALSRQHGETVGSMLERLNDYSYDNVDEAVAEDDDDNIYIDSDVIEQLLK